MDAVFLNPDMVQYIIGKCDMPGAVVNAREVNKLFAGVDVDEVLRRVALTIHDMPRRLNGKVATCVGCKRTCVGASWGQVQLFCPACRCITLLDPPTPVEAVVGERHFHYHLPAMDDNVVSVFQVDKMIMAGGWICCAGRARPSRVRVCFRVHCTCDKDPVTCLRAGTCMWTRWSGNCIS